MLDVNKSALVKAARRRPKAQGDTGDTERLAQAFNDIDAELADVESELEGLSEEVQDLQQQLDEKVTEFEDAARKEQQLQADLLTAFENWNGEADAVIEQGGEYYDIDPQSEFGSELG